MALTFNLLNLNNTCLHNCFLFNLLNVYNGNELLD